MNGYIVYDNVGHCPKTDGHGHFKVYANKAAAKRRASTENNAPVQKLTRYSVIEFVGYAGPAA